MKKKPASKTAKKKAAPTAGTVTVYTLTITYRYEDGVDCYIFPALTRNEAFALAITDLKQLIKEDIDLNDTGKELEQYPNSKKFIVGDNVDLEPEFEHYYNQFGDLSYMYDTHWNLTTTKIKGNKLTYSVEG